VGNGTELGAEHDEIFDWLADESPSNAGVVLEYSPTTPGPVANLPWVNGNSSFIRGAFYSDGVLIKRYLYTFKSGSITLVGWTPTISVATKFSAFNVAGNRVSLHALVGSTNEGIRFNKSTERLEVDVSVWTIGLAGKFVRVQSLPFITVP
jgi:hypothetical protein